MLVGTGRDYPAAVYDALLCASGVMLLALLMAVAELVRRYLPGRPAALPQPNTPPTGSDGQGWTTALTTPLSRRSNCRYNSGASSSVPWVTTLPGRSIQT